MISKIICPTDFSDTANNAAEYAVKVAYKTGATLVLRNVHSISSFEIFPPKIWAEREMKVISETLENMCAEISKEFKISCTYDIELTDPTLENAITKKATATDLIVMGTNGVDSWNQFFTGTTTYHVTHKAICPVLVVPENVVYKDIEKIVFAWDSTRDSMLSFFQLKDFISAFGAQVTVVHVNKHHTEDPGNILLDLQKEWKENITGVLFETIYSDDVIASLKEFMRYTESDILVMISREHGTVYKVFHHSVTRELTEDAEHPLLIQHF